MLRGNFVWLEGLPARVGLSSSARFASSSVEGHRRLELLAVAVEVDRAPLVGPLDDLVVVDRRLAHERGEDARADDRLALDDVDVGHRREWADAQLAAGQDLDHGLADASDVGKQS